MDQYKVQGEPLVLSHSQERVLCTAHQQEEETAAVTQNTAFCIWTRFFQQRGANLWTRRERKTHLNTLVDILPATVQSNIQQKLVLITSTLASQADQEQAPISVL